MPASSTAAGIALQNAFLNGVFGPNRGSTAADAYVVRAWFDNPTGVSPTEADFGGYTPPTWDSDDWLAADGGEVSSDGLASLGTPSSAASDAIRFWSLHDTVTDALAYWAPVEEPVHVTSGANPVRIRLTVPYGFNN